MIAENSRERVRLITVFVSTVWLLSIPFVVQDPSLKYIALLIQLVGLTSLCLYTMRNQFNNEVFLFTSALPNYLSLSPIQNILIHIPTYALVCILQTTNHDKLSVFTQVFYAVIEMGPRNILEPLY